MNDELRRTLCTTFALALAASMPTAGAGPNMHDDYVDLGHLVQLAQNQVCRPWFGDYTSDVNKTCEEWLLWVGERVPQCRVAISSPENSQCGGYVCIRFHDELPTNLNALLPKPGGGNVQFTLLAVGPLHTQGTEKELDYGQYEITIAYRSPGECALIED